MFTVEDESLADHVHNSKDLLTNGVEYHGSNIFLDKDMVKHEFRADLAKNITSVVWDEIQT